MGTTTAETIVRRALALRATQAGAQALLVLDIAFEGPHPVVPDFGGAPGAASDWLHPASPFGRLLAEAFAPEWSATVEAWSAEAADAAAHSPAWREQVLLPFAARYRLRLPTPGERGARRPAAFRPPAFPMPAPRSA